MTTLSESRTDQLWAKFAGMFGGERLARAFGKVPPREWIDLVGGLKDFELQRGVRRVMASGTDQIPTCPKFRRLCQESRNDDLDSNAPPPLPQLPSNLAAQDDWEVSASLHLLKHIRTRLGRNALAYGPIVYGRDNNGSPEQQHCTAILMHWKKHWAQMMREEATADGVDGKYQREIWDSYMRMAEQEIAQNVFGKQTVPATYAEGILA